jgi:hypothetical protein
VTVQTPQIGTYRWHHRSWRRWSGRQWAEATYSAFPKRLGRPQDWGSYPELSDVRREQLLAAVVDLEVQAGGRIVQRGPDGVTLAYRRTVTHLGHLALTVMTAGLWGFVWLAVVLSRHENQIRYEVDRWGNIWPVSAA